ncbi:MAG: NAD(+)/NADH kinase [Bacteroidota bacterium]
MRFGIIGNLDKPGLPKAVGHLLEGLEDSGTDYLVDKKILTLLAGGDEGERASRGRDYEVCLKESDMVVAFGGDGTILAAARSVGGRGTPILGVNLGKLGFLAEFAPEELDQAIEDILAKNYLVEDRLVLEATSPSLPERVFRAVNDVVVDKSRSPRIVDLEAHIDGAYAVTYRGDGLIISTPTGSTAYALSNNGPIVTPTSGVIGITPISPHTLSGRPLIVPEQSTIRVVVQAESNEVLFSADGQVEAFLTPPVEFTIRKATHPLRLVKRTDRSYFDVLRAKLLWGQDAREIRD